jgi:hypothetical protein
LSRIWPREPKKGWQKGIWSEDTLLKSDIIIWIANDLNVQVVLSKKFMTTDFWKSKKDA